GLHWAIRNRLGGARPPFRSSTALALIPPPEFDEHAAPTVAQTAPAPARRRNSRLSTWWSTVPPPPRRRSPGPQAIVTRSERSRFRCMAEGVTGAMQLLSPSRQKARR